MIFMVVMMAKTFHRTTILQQVLMFYFGKCTAKLYLCLVGISNSVHMRQVAAADQERCLFDFAKTPSKTVCPVNLNIVL